MSGERGRLPVEPLSEETWQRIRTEVFADLDAPAPLPAPPSRRQRSREVVVLAVAAVAVIGGLVLARYQPRESTAPVTSRLEAAPGSTRTTLGDVTLDAVPGTELVSMGSHDGGWTVVMERGRATFAVPPRAGRPPFRVQAGAVAVEVVGTEFSVARAGNLVRVHVDHGSVRVTSGVETALLSAGEHWESTPARTAEKQAPPPPAASAGPSGTAAAPRVPVPVQPKRASSRERYEAASELERSDPARAVALYRELSEGSDAWAANALYAAGRLELERGRRAAARTLLERYLKRFPGGANANEARALLAQSQ